MENRRKRGGKEGGLPTGEGFDRLKRAEKKKCWSGEKGKNRGGKEKANGKEKKKGSGKEGTKDEHQED